MNKEWNEFFSKNNSFVDMITDSNMINLVNKYYLDKILIKIQKCIYDEFKNFGNDFGYFPRPELVFNAFNLCPLNKVKVVIIGQDPYHNFKETISGEKIPEAMGLCFSVPNNIKKKPPSLMNIIKEVNSDLNKNYKFTDLTKWAKQGVLLLNTSLTVRQNKPGSHLKIWEIFTNSLIKGISDEYKDIVFLLWGNYAKSKICFINLEKHTCLTAVHPSPLSANRGGWFDNKHFSKTNELLIKFKKEPIDW